MLWYDTYSKISIEVNFMKYIMTFFWSVVLVSMLNYVVSSVQNVHFDPMNGLIMSIPVAIMVLIIAAIIPDEPTANAHH